MTMNSSFISYLINTAIITNQQPDTGVVVKIMEIFANHHSLYIYLPLMILILILHWVVGVTWENLFLKIIVSIFIVTSVLHVVAFFLNLFSIKITSTPSFDGWKAYNASTGLPVEVAIECSNGATTAKSPVMQTEKTDHFKETILEVKKSSGSNDLYLLRGDNFHIGKISETSLKSLGYDSQSLHPLKDRTATRLDCIHKDDKDSKIPTATRGDFYFFITKTGTDDSKKEKMQKHFVEFKFGRNNPPKDSATFKVNRTTVTSFRYENLLWLIYYEQMPQTSCGTFDSKNPAMNFILILLGS